jgi:predicted nucleotidyltransferase
MKGKGSIAQEKLELIIRRIVEVAKPEKIILFGSAARGGMGSHSDVDLLVIKAGANRLDLMGEIYRNLHGVGEPVDVIVATPEDLERYRNSHSLVFAPALKEGRVVYGA